MKPLQTKILAFAAATAILSCAGLVSSAAAQRIDLGGIFSSSGQSQQGLGQQLRQHVQQHLQSNPVPYGQPSQPQYGPPVVQQLGQHFQQQLHGQIQYPQSQPVPSGQPVPLIGQIGPYLPPAVNQDLRKIEDELRNTVLNKLNIELPPARPPVTILPVPEPPIVEPPTIGPPIIERPSCPTVPCPNPPSSGIVDPARPWNQMPGIPATLTTDESLNAEPEATSETESNPGETPLEELPEVESGMSVILEGEGFGEQPGGVYIKINELLLQTELLDWSDSFAEAELPKIPLVGGTRAILIVMTADSNIGQTLEVQLVPAVEEAPAVSESQAEEDVEAEVADEQSEETIVRPGDLFTLEGDLGSKQGNVILRIASIDFRSKIINWTETTVEFEVPGLSMTESQAAQLIILDGDNSVVDSYEVVYAAEGE